MQKKHKKPVEQSFMDDLTALSHELNDQDLYMIGYGLYACFETKEGTRMHMTSFDSSELDTLLGRIEVMKSFIIQRMADIGEKGVDGEDEHPIDKEVSDILKKFTKDDGGSTH